ncbi:serine/threonine-protein phosphatase [Salinibacterium sp. NSLL150]|uniref:PP2C family protein-serine/threonine phosphatase n=1 Tax=unclassified Salinibacterium TaxID=2632331 RepID=UPI0018CE955D|nr:MULTISPECIES: protein phosphatase 2C domain-containing protein [unclassified Salinibacterium]MBH0100176.1 serine/threonine-protein phosphatase [Salinibacterium sp. NSLL35]MBH0102930.1 serine/threonine-protein phosphatase [Salinibacterium sp. NSLL150]MBH0105690.1 serine/threonine-protein phosphatase [Salinibacterium sp. NSLL16]MBH0108450.1 serine/threonine-protein phosphatase [Salinibacterium sp. NSLL17]
MTEIGGNNPKHTIALPGREQQTFTFAWAAGTHTGHRRAANEDSYVARSPMFAVADGMGGHSAGDLASAAVVERLDDAITGDFLPARAVERALERATDYIGLIAQDSELGVGTTVTGVVVTEHHESASFAVFNVGDSRVYDYENDRLVQVTRDHSVVQDLVDAGVISREEAEDHPDANIITRAVGFNATPSPDFWMLPIQRGQRLLICSDGLTREVSDVEISQIFAKHNSAEETVSELIDSALDSGGRDNITAIVIDVLEVPTAT